MRISCVPRATQPTHAPRAAYYVAFGPHGPRKPVFAPGDSLKIFLASTAAVGAGVLIFLGVRSIGESESHNPLDRILTRPRSPRGTEDDALILACVRHSIWVLGSRMKEWKMGNLL